jgi:uncharacterized protein YutE (UPF0331/DUF86 family)
LRLLAAYISDLSELQSVNLEEYQENKLVRKAVERTLHTAIEACLDIGHHYARLDNTIVYGILKKRLSDLDEFALAIKTYLDR